MPYSYPGKIPRPALNWTAPEQKRCIAAANAVLRENGSEQSAIFACIRAAGRSTKMKVGTTRNKKAKSLVLNVRGKYYG